MLPCQVVDAHIRLSLEDDGGVIGKVLWSHETRSCSVLSLCQVWSDNAVISVHVEYIGRGARADATHSWSRQ